jgi:hypothetical protein
MLGATRLTTMTLRIKGLHVTLSINDIQRINALQNSDCRVLFIVMLNVITLSVIVLNVIILNVNILNVIMLNVFMLIAIMQNVKMLSVVLHKMTV